jgi:arylsulfatase A-like enzyme
VLKGLGYRSGQFGKNHVGDRNEHLPTVHGFDEFFGNLYHLNTEEEPEQSDWPKDAEFNRRMLPRGVLDCVAAESEPPEEDTRFAKWGKQKCADTGPLTSKRMETVDEEFLDRTLQFIERAAEDRSPFFAYYNPTRMHIYTHLRPEHRDWAAPYSSDYDLYGSGMMELDQYVGKILDKLDELRIADNTIVLFTADNGAMAAWWPDGGTTPFRGEKATTWEGGVRVPMLIRWPARIPARSVSNGIQSHMDLFTTLAEAAGGVNIVGTLRASHEVHIDGINNLEHWQGKEPSRRDRFIYYNENAMTASARTTWP